MSDQVKIFDTTLRDGEQSPGISLDVGEKLEIADQLARLGVDVIEAGFPIASDGDFESVEAIAKAVHGPIITGLSRTGFKDVDRAWEAVREQLGPYLVGIVPVCAAADKVYGVEEWFLPTLTELRDRVQILSLLLI